MPIELVIQCRLTNSCSGPSKAGPLKKGLRFQGAQELERAISAVLVIVGLINFLPVIGVSSAEVLATLYGIPALDGDLLVLMRHRAVLFGALGGLIIASAFRRHLQPVAIIAGLFAMLGFVALALMAGDIGAKIQNVMWVDVFALVGLSGVAFVRFRQGSGI